MKSRIVGRLTAAQLESKFRAERRAAGEKLHILDIGDWGPKEIRSLHRYCEANQISQSEYLRSIRALRPRLVARGESLSEHVRTLLRVDAAAMPLPMPEVR